MGRILAIDYGMKRTGIAVTDPLKIIASPLDTIQTKDTVDWLKNYMDREKVDRIVVGMPTKPDGSETNMTTPVNELIDKLNFHFPDIPVLPEDERFTSKIARQTTVLGGMKKKDRRDKSNIDKISATLILQSYLAKAKP